MIVFWVCCRGTYYQYYFIGLSQGILGYLQRDLFICVLVCSRGPVDSFLVFSRGPIDIVSWLAVGFVVLQQGPVISFLVVCRGSIDIVSWFSVGEPSDSFLVCCRGAYSQFLGSLQGGPVSQLSVRGPINSFSVLFRGTYKQFLGSLQGDLLIVSWLTVGGPVVQYAVLRYLPGRRGWLQSPTLLLPDLDSSQSTHRTVPRLKVRL